VPGHRTETRVAYTNLLPPAAMLGRPNGSPIGWGNFLRSDAGVRRGFQHGSRFNTVQGRFANRPWFRWYNARGCTRGRGGATRCVSPSPPVSVHGQRGESPRPVCTLRSVTEHKGVTALRGPKQ